MDVSEGFMADEAVSCEPVSVWKLPAFYENAGRFWENAARLNCNRAKSCHFSMVCTVSPYSRSRETVIALAGIFKGSECRIANHV
jgi:hypothetical protein